MLTPCNHASDAAYRVASTQPAHAARSAESGLRQTLECLSDLAYDAGNLVQAEAIAHEALELAHREGQLTLVQRLLYRRARVQLAVGNTDAALALLDRALKSDSNAPSGMWHPAATLLLVVRHSCIEG